MAHQPNAGGRGEGEAPLSAGGETIAAIATPPGRGGIGVVRISGPKARDLARAIAGMLPPPREATFARFRAEDGGPLDEGLVLFFPAPHSYTGEDVVELQGHGGPMVMRELLRRCVALGARVAQPGEFTRRAFLNERIDLAQAESVADLIDAASAEAARSAARSLAGELSDRVHALAHAMTQLRVHVEACIDFPEEEIDPKDVSAQREALERIRESLDALLAEAEQGAVLREGLVVVLAGRPNVGKSSLLNRLAGEEVAIVTPLAGTTRDYVRASISIEGVPIHLIDTAGLRETQDIVEKIGVERSWRALHAAGAALFIEEATGATPEDEALRRQLPGGLPFARVINKIDLADGTAAPAGSGETIIRVSAKTGQGVDGLRRWLLAAAGWKPHGEGIFMARERHLRALQSAKQSLQAASSLQALEIMAEELRLAHRALGEITGEVSADDLLGEIFASFCIGK